MKEISPNGPWRLFQAYGLPPIRLMMWIFVTSCGSVSFSRVTTSAGIGQPALYLA
jgi:hypothetical protein